MNNFDQLKELSESGEEFEVCGADALYRFRNGVLQIKKNSWSNFEDANEFRLNATLKCEIRRIPWTPKDGDIFFRVASDGRVLKEKMSGQLGFFNDLINANNYYKTEILAEIASDAEIKLRKSLKHE